MNTLLVVLSVAVVAIALLLVAGLLVSRAVASSSAKRARSALPPMGPDDREESALGLTAPYQGYGLLRVTPSDLFFVNASTREVLAIPRTAIAAPFASEDVPTGSGMRTLRRAALVLQLNDPTLPQGLGFMVSDAHSWVERLRR